ncbi:EXLDI protein [Nocardia lijiangensis]|uniref:EXLDI protein n=1 Tax=Nocardia lijiangensis TaxID=299618 RepID=UPI003D72D716
MTNDQHQSDAPPAGAAVDIHKAGDFQEVDDFPEIVLKAGPGGGRTQRFHGRRLMEARQVTKDGIEVVRVYRSRKGKYVVQRQFSEWTDFAVFTDFTRDWRNWRNMIGIDNQDWGDFTVTVVDSVEETRNLVPAKVYRTIADIAQHGTSQDLDI